MIHLRRILAVACLLTATPLFAAETYTLDIGPQSLSTALQQFAQQSGLQIVYYGKVAEGLRATGVTGNLTADQALQRLLAGTDLQFETLDRYTVAISSTKSEGAKKSSAVMGGAEEAGLRLAQLENTEDRSSTAAKAEASSEDNKIQEIIVTAQKRQQRLLDTPISMGVLSGEKLDAGSSRAVADMLRQIAGVSISANGTGNNTIAIRGVQPGAGTTTTGYYQDDVPFAFIRGAGVPDANSYDLARVEVLRGPQGTLYGVNSLNGVVRVITNDANLQQFEAKGRVRASDTKNADNNFSGDFAANLPLIPGKLAIRGVVGLANVSGFLTSTVDGRRKFNDYDAKNYRLKVNFQPLEALSLKGGFSHNVIDTGGPNLALDNFTSPFISAQPDHRVLDIYNLAAQYDFPSFSLVSTTAQLDLHTKTRAAIVGINYWQINPIDSFSEEVRAASSGEGPWQWVAGGLYKNTEEHFIQDARPTFLGILEYNSRSRSYAAYADLTRQLFDDELELTGGLRYFDDEVHFTQQGAFAIGAPLVIPKTGHYNKLTGRALVTWKPQDDRMFYASYSTGFRSGVNQSPSVLLVQPTFPDARPDSITAYEGGAKGRLGDRLTYEGAVYYQKWDDLQQGLRVDVFAAIANAGKASGWGAEGALSFKPVSILSLNASIGWNDLAYDQNVFTTVGTPPASFLLFREGDRLNDSPEWTGAIGADLRTGFTAGLDFYATSDFTYTEARIVRFLTATTLTSTVSDKIYTLSATFGVEGAHWSLGVFGENLLDEDGATSGRSAGFLNEAPRLWPRTIGVQASYKY